MSKEALLISDSPSPPLLVSVKSYQNTKRCSIASMVDGTSSFLKQNNVKK